VGIKGRQRLIPLTLSRIAAIGPATLTRALPCSRGASERALTQIPGPRQNYHSRENPTIREPCQHYREHLTRRYVTPSAFLSHRGTVGPRDGSHPNSLRASPSLVSPAVPNTATSRLIGTSTAVPRSTPNFVTLGAGRGAISGTGLAPRHQGPSQIGRPKAFAGINGTTIKPVR
jgi:hypothetical protein